MRVDTHSNPADRRTTEPWALRNALALLAAGAGAAIVAFTLTYWATDGVDKDRFDVGLKSATATAAIVAGILTWGRLELSRHEHRLSVDRDLTERYGRAVDQLCKDETTARVGGVFAMERFALDAFAVSGPDRDTDWRMAIDLLADFARQHRAKRASDHKAASESHLASHAAPVRAVPTEVVAAVRTLGRFAKRTGHADPSQVRYNLNGIDLAGVDLRGDSLVAADLIGADFTNADLTGADLTRVDLTDTDLTGARLHRANLTDADLRAANLTGANLSLARLNHADLTHTNLTHAFLRDADLTGADLTFANLGGANFTDVDLRGVDLSGADLRGARFNRANLADLDLSGRDLSDANFTDACLIGARLTDADLSRVRLKRANLARANLARANLGGADLGGADFTGADFDGTTAWPDGFSPPVADG